MDSQEKRNCLLKIYVTEEEKNFIQEKMKVAKIKSMSTYLRKVAIESKIEIRDYSEFKNFRNELNKIGVNINQISRRVNETRSVYKEDLKDIQDKQEEIWQLMKAILSRMST